MSQKRHIRGLYQASRSTRPRGLPKGRPRGAKAAGLRYERALLRALPQIEHGPWFEYKDANGPGWCQPDGLLELESFALVLEVKYSWTAEAFEQLHGLYLPVVSMALRKPAIGIQVCKRLLPAASSTLITGNAVEAICEANKGKNVTLHWLENTPISLNVRRAPAPVALKAPDDVCVVRPDRTIIGTPPVTFRRDLGGSY